MAKTASKTSTERRDGPVRHRLGVYLDAHVWRGLRKRCYERETNYSQEINRILRSHLRLD